ncbi:hypothetical protein REB14_01780 [Chryseobacterium sp. ES2]|uniref:Spi protease inhibitor domain-containing protein n=2 Tax=Chryseobacterium metallicongregator TaxID=3073042 RepID=A0ABU1DZD5_9FLAO|nr:hypothetical protein [Chryseobacterium sp. ES2]
MKKKIIILMSIIITFLCAVNTPQKNISYKSARNYFIKNAYDKRDFAERLITSHVELDYIFWTSITIEADGKPISIVFTPQRKCIGSVYPKTNFS